MAMKRRTVYLDTYWWGNGHEMFNAGLLALCIQAAQGGEVLCRATKSSFAAITGLLSQNGIGHGNVKFRPVFTISGESRYASVFRYVWSALLSVGRLLLSKKTDLIIIPYNNLFALKHINRLNRLLGRSVVIFCHGELEYLAPENPGSGAFIKLLRHCCRNFYLDRKARMSDGLYFSVLGDRIKENLREYVAPQIWDRFLVMDHPYFFPHGHERENKHSKRRTLRLGTCGVMTRSKGAAGMADFARSCRDAGLDVSIVHIGRAPGCVQELKDSGVETASPDNRPLPREEYDRLAGELDYMLFFYPTDSYRLTASGAVMDAIAMRKPVIALRTDYFEYIFGKFGKAGYLVDSTEQMVETVERLSRGKLKEPKIDYDAIQRKFSPGALAGQFYHIMKKALE